MSLNVLNQGMSNIISDSSKSLHPAAAHLEPLHDQLDDARNEQLKFADWCQQKAVPILGQCTVTRAEGPGVLYVRSLRQALFATYVDALVPCPGSHQLLALDSCATARHG